MNHYILLAGSISETLPGLNRLRGKLSESLEPEKIARIRVDRMNKIADKHPEADRLGYVAGPIADTNPLTAYRNAIRLQATAMKARAKHDIPVVTPLDKALPFQAMRRVNLNVGMADTVKIQREILTQSPITDVFMAPGWEESRSARDDHDTAQRLPGVTVHYPQGEQKEKVA